MQVKEENLESLKIEINNKVNKEIKKYDLHNYFKQVRTVFEGSSYKKMMEQTYIYEKVYANAIRNVFQSSTIDVMMNRIPKIQNYMPDIIIPNYMGNSIAIELKQISNMSSVWQSNYERLLRPTKQIADMIANITKMNLDIIPNIVNSIEFRSVFDKIELDEFQINEDGSVQYENEKLYLTEETTGNLLLEINNNVKDIKQVLSSKKSLIIIILFFIFTAISSGFFEEVGKDMYGAFKHFIKENRLESITIKEQQNEFSKNYMQVNADILNVRETPSSDSKLIGKLYNYQCVKVIEKASYWTKIEYKNARENTSITGWVFTRYLMKFDEDTFEWINLED